MKAHRFCTGKGKGEFPYAQMRRLRQPLGHIARNFPLYQGHSTTKECLSIKKLSLIFVFMAFSPLLLADTTKCTIEIEDLNTGTKYIVEHKFSFSQGAAAQQRHFKLPGSDYSCTLAFFDLDSGTTLSCEFDEFGHNFIQSDRSVVTEKQAINNLSFRYKHLSIV